MNGSRRAQARKGKGNNSGAVLVIVGSDRNSKQPWSKDYMQQAIPLSDMGHRWLDQAKERLLAEPGRFKVLEYAGCAEKDLIPVLVQQAEAFSRGMDDGTTVRKRLVNVMMEAVDNVGKHALGILCNASFILLVRDARGYLLATGNAVPIATATLLEHRIGLLNDMHREDLREHYLKLLSNGSRSAHGGAGLGLLTLARQCNLPIEVRSDALGPYTAYLTFGFRVDLVD